MVVVISHVIKDEGLGEAWGWGGGRKGVDLRASRKRF